MDERNRSAHYGGTELSEELSGDRRAGLEHFRVFAGEQRAVEVRNFEECTSNNHWQKNAVGEPSVGYSADVLPPIRGSDGGYVPRWRQGDESGTVLVFGLSQVPRSGGRAKHPLRVVHFGDSYSYHEVDNTKNTEHANIG